MDVLVHETWRTLRDDLPPPPARLLDVGCGSGALAARLQQAGYDVTALDRSEEAAAMAAARGLRAVARDLLEFDDAPYDVVLFARSLHHVHPLDAGLDRARALLMLGGALVVDDFCVELADEPTTAWLADHEAALADRGLLEERDHWRRADASPMQAWHEHHHVEHQVHPGELLERAIAASFTVRSRREQPYLFRYLCSRLLDLPGAADEARRLLAEEQAAIATGAIRPLGRRWVAAHRA